MMLDACQMREFFKPHMQMFARLVGQSFGTWAVDDKEKKVHYYTWYIIVHYKLV